jgi:hypothetical protein
VSAAWTAATVFRTQTEWSPAAGRVNQIVAVVRRLRGDGGITTAVQGAGGFSETAVAKLARPRQRVLRPF